MATIEHDGFTIESSHETQAAMRAAMEIPSAVDATAEASAETPEDAAVSAEVEPSTEVAANALTESEPIAHPGKKAKPRDNTQARISQAIAKQHDAERRAADLEARLTALESQRRPEPAAVHAPEPAKANKPSADDIGTKYQSYEDYVDALTDWKLSERLKSVDDVVDQRLTARERQQTERQQMQAFQARRAAVEATYPDYAEKVAAADDMLKASGLGLTVALERAILSSDQSGDLVYWLASHPDQYAQLASETRSLDAAAAPLVRTLLETRLGAGVSPGSAPLAELPRAKPPVRPVGVSSVTVPDEPDENEPFDAYFKRMNAVDRKAGRR